VPPELATIVGKTMMVDKAKRFGSMDELHSALAGVASKLS
jgi:hypothetical protein